MCDLICNKGPLLANICDPICEGTTVKMSKTILYTYTVAVYAQLFMVSKTVFEVLVLFLQIRLQKL